MKRSRLRVAPGNLRNGSDVEAFLVAPVDVAGRDPAVVDQLGDLLWSVVGEGNASRAVMGLVLYSAIFGLLAAVGYRRDERKRYA